MSDFVICINNESNPASLILGKVYRTLSDAEAEARNMLRVIDEDKSEAGRLSLPRFHVRTYRTARSGKASVDGNGCLSVRGMLPNRSHLALRMSSKTNAKW